MLALDRVFDAANGILDLTFGLFALSLALYLLVAKHLAGLLLNVTLDLLSAAFYPIFVDHDFLPRLFHASTRSCHSTSTVWAGRRFLIVI